MRIKGFITRTALSALIATGIALVPALTWEAAAADQTKNTATVTLKITGMTCAGCAVSVKMAAQKVDGVAEVKVSYENARADVTYDPAKATPAQVAKAITDNSGFKAEVQPSKTGGDQPAISGKRPGGQTSSLTLKVEGLPLRGKQY